MKKHCDVHQSHNDDCDYCIIEDYRDNHEYGNGKTYKAGNIGKIEVGIDK